MDGSGDGATLDDVEVIGRLRTLARQQSETPQAFLFV
jgi:hypothetical protein